MGVFWLVAGAMASGGDDVPAFRFEASPFGELYSVQAYGMCLADHVFVGVSVRAERREVWYPKVSRGRWVADLEVEVERWGSEARASETMVVELPLGATTTFRMPTTEAGRRYLIGVSEARGKLVWNLVEHLHSGEALPSQADVDAWMAEWRAERCWCDPSTFVDVRALITQP